ncbi:MAG: hypothetical protein JW783_07475 [Bacteroidales bacterium]|nr:hypothetical protein [Bacteroidales bacterium]MBN2748742.1 hypothetical protein [Bacteroidales bacterium]
MDDNDNIFERIQEILGKTGGGYSILEQQVDVNLQMEYFNFSRERREKPFLGDMLILINDLYNDKSSVEAKRGFLVDLASVDKPEAYRAIEKFVTDGLPELKDWAILALQESRMLLESRLLDEEQIFISTGLGGQKDKLRYFVAYVSISEEGFTAGQRNALESEVKFCLARHESLLETFVVEGKFAMLLALVPLHVPVQDPFKMILNECNALGEFIREGFIITNVKILSPEEIQAYLDEQDRKMGVQE